MNTKIANLFDALNHAERFFGWKMPNPVIHKTLDFSKSAELKGFDGGDINDVLLSLPLKLHRKSCILDAGCGHGATLANFVDRYHCSGVGISLSEAQIRSARKLFSSKKIDFRVCSYDCLPNQQFDLIVCVESLVHSPTLHSTYKALSERLVVGGYFIAVEDMFRQEKILKDPSKDFSFELFKKYWAVEDLYGLEHHMDAAHQAGLKLENKLGVAPSDLSACVVTRPDEVLLAKIARAMPLARFFPWAKVRLAVLAAIGGYFLEHYYNKHSVEYRLLIFKKTNSLSA